MEQLIQIRCKNNKKIKNISMGSTLFDIFREFNLDMPYGPVSAKVNNRVEGLHYRVYHNKDVEFLDLHSSSGSRTYTRSLFFVLCKAVEDLYPNSNVIIDIPVSNGYYCNLNIGRPLTNEDVDKIRTRMQELIDAKIPFIRRECTTEEAIKLFSERGFDSKVKLLKSVSSLYTNYYELDGSLDYFYGSLLVNTSQLKLFGVEKYFDGLLLRIPSISDPSKLGELVNQGKMFEMFKEHHAWQNIMEVSTIGDVNEAVQNGFSSTLINVSEALQEKKISQMADAISNSHNVKVVLIAGPSSSGKTTFSKRLSIQLMACGKKPISVSLDDYFLDRELTPKDDDGDYDFESLYALNIPLFNEQLNDLLEGKEVELPKYNFQNGKSEKGGNKLKLNEDNILILEGIHALNPNLTCGVPENAKFRVYASALTTVLLDTHNYVPTTDNRLLRRIVRDNRYRGVTAQETIRRWPSVRAGENKWIFPYQENADMMFNTAMIFELAVLKTQVEPLLELVPESAEEYSEAYRLKKFLGYIRPVPNRQLPPTSLLREFLGGSSFKY
ncbi:nucleoside kinase [Xylanibacter oryzae]|uniref:nucleoside kinase n=1 Tax=Xylanibacter oryzae TaxID=185293 RepID=UPI0004BBA756|nr:nucleoside kinase [Xylanibacter oryzae]